MTGISLVLSLLLPGGVGEPAAQAALAVPLDSGRSAILFRSVEPGQLGLFLPRENGTFELRLLPPFHVPIAAMALGDRDGDGDLDLALSLQDGTVALWLGDGRGEFFPRQATPAGHHPPGHGHGILAPALAPEEERAVRELLARPVEGEMPRPSLAGLPAGFAPLAFASGRFSSSETEETALIGSGSRPRLLLAQPGGAGTREVSSPQAVHTVFVGDEGGNTFNPSALSIQTGDTVHWVWSFLGHNVVSGAGCLNDNLFCSPSNTNCGANPTSSAGATYDRVFPTAGTFPYFCRPHCFLGMTGTVTVAAASASVLEATDLRVARGSPDPSQTQFTFSPACGATGHAIYSGQGSLASGPVWTQSLCADASGTHLANIGDPTGLQYFVVVGQNASAEGSYGTGAGGAERPEAVGIGACDRPRVISTSCP